MERNPVAYSLRVEGEIPKELADLTEQEWSVLYYLTCALTIDDIALQLTTSKVSVEKSCGNIMRQINCDTIPKIKDYLNEKGLVFQID
jgi:DNA-binding NarL/FixJ family response regulator